LERWTLVTTRKLIVLFSAASLADIFSVGLKVSFLEPHVALESNDTVPSVLNYTLEKSVVDDICLDLASKVIEKRRQHDAVSSQIEPDTMDFENSHPHLHDQGLNLDKNVQVKEPHCEEIVGPETQGSTQAREDRRQLQNMV
jgi:hypothetical protein